jgi:hypothetical protein
MSYLNTVGAAPLRPTLTSESSCVPSSHQDEIKRITINLSHNISPPVSPFNSPIAKGGAGV